MTRRRPAKFKVKTDGAARPARPKAGAELASVLAVAGKPAAGRRAARPVRERESSLRPTKLMPSFPPRDVADHILSQVLARPELGNSQFLDQALARVREQDLGDPRSAAWLMETCAGILRWRGILDEVLGRLALKKPPTGDLRRSLYQGLYPILAQSEPKVHVIVSEIVDWVRATEGEPQAKFANALLRKASEHRAEWRRLALEPRTSAEDARAWSSLPRWFWDRLVRDRGWEWADAFARACLERPTTHFRVKPGRSAPGRPSVARLSSVNPNLRAFEDTETPVSSDLPNLTGLAAGGDIKKLAGFSEGDWIVQDLSSQRLVDEVVASAGKPGRALDFCAAPGGKAVALSWSGWDVTATDASEDRLVLLRETVKRAAPDVKVITQAQLGAPSTAEALFDLVWVDAPCSGSGIIRRHPDARWLKTPDGITSLMKLQKEILERAWAHVRPGGYLAYSVCSVFKDEGEERTAAFVRATGAERVKEWLLAPQEAPHGDGFYGALVRRKSGV